MIRGTDFILNPDKLEEQFQLVEVSEWIDYNTKEKLGFYYTVLFPKLKFEKIKVGNGSYTHARNITDCMTRLCRENKLNGGGITKLRKTTSSDLQAKGTPKSVVASMLGHTTEVNEKYYTYDTSNLAEKKKIIQERNAKFKNLAHTG